MKLQYLAEWEYDFRLLHVTYDAHPLIGEGLDQLWQARISGHPIYEIYIYQPNITLWEQVYATQRDPTSPLQSLRIFYTESGGCSWNLCGTWR